MFAQIYRSTSPRRTTLRAVFDKASTWGAARGGQPPENWALEDEVDIDRPNRNLPFSAAEAAAEIRSVGIFMYQVKATELEQAQHILLNNYRLKFTLPIFCEPQDGFELLGTGTLFEHEGRHFIVTADHIFRTDIDDPNSLLVDMTTVGVPAEPRASGTGAAEMLTLGQHTAYRIKPPVFIDTIVIELLEPEVIETLKRGWAFLPFSQAENPTDDDDRFVITGFMGHGLRFENNVVSQAMLNLETDYLHYTPLVKDPVPDLDLFFHLQAKATNFDGSPREVKTLRGLSGGPIWAVRDAGKDELWAPSKAMKIVAVQSSELKDAVRWSRGFRWEARPADLATARGPPAVSALTADTWLQPSAIRRDRKRLAGQPS